MLSRNVLSTIYSCCRFRFLLLSFLYVLVVREIKHYKIEKRDVEFGRIRQERNSKKKYRIFLYILKINNIYFSQVE